MFGSKKIDFVDPEVERLCAINWGNGTSITYAQAAKVTNLGNVFTGNTTITSFDELKYFTGLTYLYGANNVSTGAFSGCTSLVSITLPDSLVDIRQNVFNGCTSLVSCTGGNVTNFGLQAFQNCTSLENIDISKAVTIGNIVFESCPLTGIVLNLPYLTSIGARAFNNTGIVKISNLGSVTSLPDHNYGYGVFSNCSSLVEVNLPSGLTYIGSYCFINDTALTTVIINGNTTFRVRDYAFQSCTSLVTFPFSNVHEIDARAFRYTGITTLHAPNLTTLAGDYMFGDALISITSLGSATSLPNNSFRQIAGLSSVVLPNTLTTIGSSVFYRTNNLLSVTIPASVTSIGGEAFQTNNNPERAKTYIILATTPPSLGSNVFYNYKGGYNINNVSIYVPYSADHSILNTYKSASVWSTYATRIFELDENGNIPA